MLFALYRCATFLAAPLLPLYYARRASQGKEEAARIPERYGRPGVARPAGKLVWIHAASVGEAQSALFLIRHLRAKSNPPAVLLTTGTVTSAQRMATQLPKGAHHQYLPADTPRAVKRFFDHWQPDAALWLESELWPNLLAAARARGLPMALLNARLSARSRRQWQRARGLVAPMLRGFSLILTQTAADAAAFSDLGAKGQAAGAPQAFGNLKYAAEALPDDLAARAELKAMIGERPVWLMASTHAEEEFLAAEAHRALAAKLGPVLTLIAPRHPARGQALAADLRSRGFKLAHRSKGEAITKETDLYLIDRLGELGIFYRLSPVAVIGGSFGPVGSVGGHNPIEAAQCGAALICGPDMTNFSEVAEDLERAGGLLRLGDKAALAPALTEIFQKPERTRRMAAAATQVAAEKRAVGTRIAAAIDAFLSKAGVVKDE